MSTVLIKVNEDECIGCGNCLKVCPVGVYKIVEGRSRPVNEDKCILCRACITHCPKNCIEIGFRASPTLARLYEE
ncbi:MAG: 4Fe-4S binding protein [Thermoproteales archaeon]|nr:4Fe-4S binding protein [Thermoproteales archaeon]RLE65450.1 MAG: ferredoxin [Thermoprotei archaeon]